MNNFEGYFYMVMVVSVLALGVAFILSRWVLAKDTGTEKMRLVSDAINVGAEAFLKRQYSTIFVLSIVLAIILGAFYYHEKGAQLAWMTVVSFLFGAICSAFAGFVGMYISIRANIRTASAATTNLNTALQIALRGGAVSGILVVAMSLLGVGLLFWIFKGLENPTLVPLQIVGYGFGASFVALFAQLGGGIYTKAADVGADLVGKVEAGIPEDDPRNPAVIADLVGDNVGDCAGRGADLFESTAAENIGAMILGIALYKLTGPDGNPIFGLGAILFPLLARAFGLIASIIGIYSVSVRGSEEAGWEDPMKSLNRGYFVTTVLAIIGFGIAVFVMLRGSWYFVGAGIVGILCSYAFVWITQYYTEYRYRPVKWIAESCQTGPATTIISGLSVGMECTLVPIIVIAAALMSSYWLGLQGMVQILGGWDQLHAVTTPSAAGLYGTAIATMGMLSTAAYILAMDTFGPITDNAGGIVEMSEQPKEIRDKTDRLDAVGNTTKALTKGYAVGSAALAAFLLFQAYIDEVNEYILHNFAAAREMTMAQLQANPALMEVAELLKVRTVDLGHPPVFVGGMIGAMLVFLFSALAIRAVGQAAQTIIVEVRRQFREKPGIMKGTEKPDYAACVDIVTKGALKAMILPGVLPVLVPAAVGFGLKHVTKEGTSPQAVAAMLMVGTIVGVLMALFMNNGGGAWDNAKKYIETGAYGGKGSDSHKAAVVGDTVGDPFKDTAGPSLHVLIKLLATVTLVLAPLFI